MLICSIQTTSDPTEFREYYRARELQSSSSAAIAALTHLPPRHIAEFLTTAFFQHAESNYFFVKQSWLASKMDAVYSEDKASLDVSTTCILFMVLAIGTQYAYLQSTATQGIPSARTAGSEPSAFSEDALGVSFYQQACRLLPDIITISSLESVQACLLIGLYTLPLDASGLSHVYLNLAVRLAIQNGMHRRHHRSAFVGDVAEQSNRVWWTAFTMER